MNYKKFILDYLEKMNKIINEEFNIIPDYEVSFDWTDILRYGPNGLSVGAYVEANNMLIFSEEILTELNFSEAEVRVLVIHELSHYIEGKLRTKKTKVHHNDLFHSIYGSLYLNSNDELDAHRIQCKGFSMKKFSDVSFRLALLEYKLKDKVIKFSKVKRKKTYTEDEMRKLFESAVKAGTVTYVTDIRPTKK